MLNTVIIPNNKYNKAMSLYEIGNYEEAKSAFQELGNYKDSADMIVDCNYGLAMTSYENENYSSAKFAFEELGDYKDSADMILECDYNMAMKSYEDGDYYYAITAFEKMNGYRDSDSMIKSAQESIYNEAMTLFDSKEFSKAKENFEKIPDYENVPEMIDLCKKQEVYKSVDDDLKKNGDFNSACNVVGRKNFTEFMEEYGYTEELKKFQEDFKKFAGTYIYETPYKTNEYTITINSSDWTFSIDETSEDFESFRHFNHGIEYKFEIEREQSFKGYSEYSGNDYYEINDKRDVLKVNWGMKICEKKK